MYLIHIELEGGPACVFPAGDDLYAATAVWQFMIENLKPGRRVLLLTGDESQIVKAAVSGEPRSQNR